ncbi:MAG: hypothetical protein WCI92_16640 [Bacteroidota bacterium]
MITIPYPLYIVDENRKGFGIDESDVAEKEILNPDDAKKFP